MSCDYATLEEAFGVTSFMADEPQIMRGGVGKTSEERHLRVMGALGHLEQPAPLQPAPVSTEREPQELCRVQLAHARGGAAAAWNAVPEHIRTDMMWYAIRQFFDGDLALMALVGVIMYLLLR